MASRIAHAVAGAAFALVTSACGRAPSSALDTALPRVDCSDGVACQSEHLRFDYSENPAQRQKIAEVTAIAESRWASIQAWTPFHPDPQRFVELKLVKGLSDAAHAIADASNRRQIKVQADWFERFPNEVGMLIHELTHVAQGYPAHVNGHWFTEAFADFVRFKVQNDGGARAQCDRDPFRHYTQGYWCGAAFLLYLESLIDVRALNHAVWKGVFVDSQVEWMTGRTMEDLWTSCKEKGPCKGGR